MVFLVWTLTDVRQQVNTIPHVHVRTRKLPTTRQPAVPSISFSIPPVFNVKIYIYIYTSSSQMCHSWKQSEHESKFLEILQVQNILLKVKLDRHIVKLRKQRMERKEGVYSCFSLFFTAKMTPKHTRLSFSRWLNIHCASSQQRRQSETRAVNFSNCSWLSAGNFTFLLAVSSASFTQRHPSALPISVLHF